MASLRQSHDIREDLPNGRDSITVIGHLTGRIHMER